MHSNPIRTFLNTSIDDQEVLRAPAIIGETSEPKNLIYEIQILTSRLTLSSRYESGKQS